MADLIEDVLIPALKADTQIAALVGSRVYWVKPPGESYTYPFLTVIEGGNSESDVADDEEIESAIIPVVEIFSKTEFRTLQYHVQRVMRKLNYIREAGPDEWIQELKCYHKAINFR